MEWEHLTGCRSRVAAELSLNGEGLRRTGPRKESEKTRRDRRAGCRVGGGLQCGQIQLHGEEDGLLFSPESFPSRRIVNRSTVPYLVSCTRNLLRGLNSEAMCAPVGKQQWRPPGTHGLCQLMVRQLCSVLAQ